MNSQLLRSRALRHLVLLGVVPVLLGVLLSMMKRSLDWQAEHPPLSSMDRVLRDEVAKASWISISACGATWQRMTGLNAFNLKVKDKAILDEMVATLRCTEHKRPVKSCDILINLAGLAYNLRSRRPTRIWFVYMRDPNGSYLYNEMEAGGMQYGNYCTLVHPRFAHRFEALVVRLVRHAKVKGMDSKVKLTPLSRGH